MIYLNRDKTTKELKPTNGFKSTVPNQKWRIYELNNKIKPFRLSRSKFSDYLTRRGQILSTIAEVAANIFPWLRPCVGLLLGTCITLCSTGCLNMLCQTSNHLLRTKNTLLSHKNGICTFMRCGNLTYVT